MRALRRLFGHFSAYHAHGRPIIQYSGMVGLAALPLFYLLRFTKVEPPFDDLGLRVVGMLLCLGLALRLRWPLRLQSLYLPFAYVTLLYCLPFFFVFTALVNGGGTVGVANTMMAVIFVVLMADWRNGVLMLVMGTSAAAALYSVVVPAPQWPIDYLARAPIAFLVFFGGSIFKYAQKQAETEMVRLTYTALAGSIAHEMRNPLIQIKQNLEGMQGALPPPTVTARPQMLAPAAVDDLYRHLAQGELAVSRGLQVITMTLDEVSAKPLDKSRFSFLSAAEATAKAVREYGYDSDEHRGRVHLHVVSDFTFRGDETAYLFVLFNLIKNALYYLPVRPQLRVDIEVRDQEVVVRDSGPGIEPEVLPRLFEPFRSTNKTGGTGLGLAYCQRVVRAFGGDISCQSVPGSHTAFTMRLPQAPVAEIEAHQNVVWARGVAALSGKSILVVDDDSTVRQATLRKLEPLGARVVLARDGAAALEMLRAQPHDLVVLDLHMPGLDGYAVATRVRRGEAGNPLVPILAHSSEPGHIAAVKAAKAGMDGFIGKPVSRHPLLEAILQAMDRSAGRSRPAGLLGRTLIVADDTAWNRKAVSAYLREAGATVIEAEHGQAVVDLVRAGSPVDAILLDLQMPGLDGFETARALRSGPGAGRDVPLLAMTARSDAAAMDAAAKAGMNDFITKPVDPQKLYEKLVQLGATRKPALPPPPLAADAHSLPGSQPPAPMLALLEEGRLHSHHRLGLLDDMVGEGLPELERLVARAAEAAEAGDLQCSRETLHSLLGMTGEMGAQALYHGVRRAYVPMVERGEWPADPAWPAEIQSLAVLTAEALRSWRDTRASAS